LREANRIVIIKRKRTYGHRCWTRVWLADRRQAPKCRPRPGWRWNSWWRSASWVTGIRRTPPAGYRPIRPRIPWYTRNSRRPSWRGCACTRARRGRCHRNLRPRNRRPFLNRRLRRHQQPNLNRRHDHRNRRRIRARRRWTLRPRTRWTTLVQACRTASCPACPSGPVRSPSCFCLFTQHDPIINAPDPFPWRCGGVLLSIDER